MNISGRKAEREKRSRRTDRIILEHAERPALARPDHGAIVASQGHGDEPDGDGSGFGFLKLVVSFSTVPYTCILKDVDVQRYV